MPRMILSFNCFFLLSANPPREPCLLQPGAGMRGLHKGSGSPHSVLWFSLRTGCKVMLWDQSFQLPTERSTNSRLPGVLSCQFWWNINTEEIFFFYFGFLIKTAWLQDDLCTCKYFQKVSFNIVPSLVISLITWAQLAASLESACFSSICKMPNTCSPSLAPWDWKFWGTL